MTTHQEPKANYIATDYWFILLWLLLNLVQAYFTELTSDEGYYWFYASKLEWGYYDHPPLLAFLIQAGYALFPNELGVRIMGIVLQAVSLLVFFRLLPEGLKDRNKTYLIMLSIPLFSYLTFIVFPDTPLLSFLVFYLYGYKRLLEKDDWWASLIMGLVLALMLYSKYHAVLVVFFIVLSNIKLLLRPKFILSLFIAFVLFFPHLYWQYSNEFPSFQYHLSGRSSPSLSFKHFFGYVPEQLAAIGPVMLVIPFLYKPGNTFERSLKFIIVGTLIFFTLASFRGRVHLHWTSIILFPLIIVASQYFDKQENNRLLYRGLLPFLVAAVILRLHLMVQVFPAYSFSVDYYHYRDLWAEDVAAIAGDRPVLFENNLREAPLYTFYTGKEGIAMYPEARKKSQYEIWNFEDQKQGQDVLIVRDKPFLESTALKTRMGKEIHYLSMPDFSSYQNIKITLDESVVKLRADSVILPIVLHNHRQEALAFEADAYGNPPKLYTRTVTSEGRKEFYKSLTPDLQVPPNGEKTISVAIPLKTLEAGRYRVQFGFDELVFYPSENSRIYDLRNHQIFSSIK